MLPTPFAPLALIRASWKAIVFGLGFALLAGWSVHRDSPQGLQLKAATVACEPMVHGWAFTFQVLLGVLAGVAVMLALVAVIGRQLRLLSATHEGLALLVRRCLAVALVWLAALLLGGPLLQATVPLVPPPGCAVASIIP
jgi:hypothetical protein